jgi:uncharacterized membrane protein
MSLRRKTYILLAARVFFNAFGDVELSNGMKHLGAVGISSFALIEHTIWRVVTSGTVWLGVASLAGFFACHLLLFSWADYSYVMPTNALNYVIVPLFALLIAGELVNFTRWLGIAIIFLGVVFVNISAPAASEAR